MVESKILDLLETKARDIINNISADKETSARRFYSVATILLHVYRERKRIGIDEAEISKLLERESMTELATPRKQTRHKIKKLNFVPINPAVAIATSKRPMKELKPLLLQLEREFSSVAVITPDVVVAIIAMIAAIVKLISELSVFTKKKQKVKKRKR